MRLVYSIVLLAVAAPSLWGQAPSHSLGAGGANQDSASTEPIAPGTHYRAGALHRALLGGDYRRLWTTRISVPVLDLQHYAGGLRAIERGGGKQTTSLHMDAADGRKFSFRSVNKSGMGTLRPELKGSIIGRIWQDQVSALYPAGAVIVPPLLQSVGVLTLRPQLFVMPDDPALGTFRTEFSGMLGMLEQWPTPPFQGAREITTTDQLYQRLMRDPHQRVDSRAFLAARLMDIYIGDIDRHEDQWLWLNRGDGNGVTWQPLGIDRDYAFVRYRGLLLSFARLRYPELVQFGDHYPNLLGLNWHARSIDRRLLGDLDQATWDSVAQALTTHLTDSVIDLSVRQLPQPFYKDDGARLIQALRQRRDRLPEVARRFYRMLALDAEVYGTDADETVVATQGPKGSLDLAIRAKDGTADGDLYYHRRFDQRTKEVRLLLGGGVDTVLVRGTGGGPGLRVLGDSGTKVVSDVATGGWTRVYSPKPIVTVLRGSDHVAVDQRGSRQPDSTSVIHPAPRDWGHWWTYSPWIGGSDRGAFIGVGTTLFDYGFRQSPYAFRLDLRGGYGTDAGAFAGEILGDLRRESSASHFLFRGYGSGADVRRFFGFGNETTRTASNTFSKVYQQEYQVSTAVGWSMGRYLTARLGPVLKYSSTEFARGGLIREVRPYGSGRFGELGAEAALGFDSRDTAAAPSRGAHLDVEGHVYPSVWDVTSTFGEVHGEAATYLTAPISLRPTLALRVGGKRVWGSFPFQEAAFIGGRGTVPGLYSYRFQGDAAAFGNAELRLPVSKFNLLAPGELGAFGLADVGRVWVTGESSNTWHSAFGGGLSIAYLNRSNTVSVAAARGDKRTALYLGTGFMF